MNVWLPITPLFAQNRMLEMGREFRGDNAVLTINDLLIGVAFLVGGGLFFWLLKVLRRRQDKTHPYNSPRRLFRALCKLHGLSGHERALLRRAASVNGLKHPGQLFVMPDKLLALKGKLSQHDAAAVRPLCHKLFGINA